MAVLKSLTLVGGWVMFTFWALPGNAGAADFIVGIGTHSESDQGLALVQAAGIRNLRDDIHWQEVEREKGVLVMPTRYDHYVDESLHLGIQPILVLCYGNSLYEDGGFPTSREAMEAYTRFAEFVVSHFRNRVRFYEIWNEWNIATSMPPGTPHGKPEPYVALLHKVYARLKAADEKMTVIGGALSGNGVEKGWLETACQAGILESLDAFSFHPYCYRQEPGERIPEDGFVDQIRVGQEVTRRYQKREIPIFITEVGWPTHSGPDGSTPEDSARFLMRAYLLARTLPSVRGVWWYDLRDDGADPNEREHHFGLMNRDYTPKPAYAAMAAICQLFQDTQFVGEIAAVPGAHILKFRRDSGATLFALWSSTDAGCRVTLEPSPSAGQPEAASYKLGAPPTPVEWKRVGTKWRLIVELTGTARVLESSSKSFDLTICSDVRAALHEASPDPPR